MASVLLVCLSENGKSSSIKDAHNPTRGIARGSPQRWSFKLRHSVIKQHIVVTSLKCTISELFTVQMACCVDIA